MTFTQTISYRENSWEDTLSTTDQLTIALSKGGFSLKGFTFSGKDPPEHLSNDKNSVVVGGLKWFPKQDAFSTNELNFAKKIGVESVKQWGV